MAAAVALLVALLLSCWGRLLGRKKTNGDRCSHHSECFSDCCLMDLNLGGAFCAAKARKNMACLPQTKGATNIICPCKMGLTCSSKDMMCPRRCHLI
ncbi:colipase-like protein 2 isoform X2 [Sciurus carolinensis]|uniref:Colipase like 2 n=1 Tax=Sciurus vulgaris TaxID=55149 RepID=A0A8D2CP00_SCIVU|nr:colipase-like protein 2 isoform X2 [Sciurus carolinensis]